jgi:hypothetical protein
MTDYTNRALAAWYRAGATGNAPSARMASAGGREYVVLRGQRALGGPVIVAVYRVRNDGVLKGLRRWPRELEAE